MSNEIEIPKRKKDFKLREDIVREFEHYAPSGKQTAIVEQLISEWVLEQKRRECHEAVQKAYGRDGSGTEGINDEDVTTNTI